MSFSNCADVGVTSISACKFLNLRTMSSTFQIHNRVNQRTQSGVEHKVLHLKP